MAEQNDFDMKQAMFVASDGVLGAAVLIFIGVYGGAWLDDKFHTAPWLVITLALGGGIVGLMRLVNKANALNSISPTPKSSPSSKTSATGGDPES